MGINPQAYLARNFFAKGVVKEGTRDGFGRGLVKAGEENDRVVVLSADLMESNKCDKFREQFPERFLEVGVAEQNLATVAAGMAALGKIPFISSFAVFSPGRNNEQIRTTISYNNFRSKKGKEINVKIVGGHAGISADYDGATHQAFEDVALMRVQPGMTVVVPCDALECEKAVVKVMERPGPVYLRIGKVPLPTITTVNTPFQIGKIEEFRTGNDCTIIANGMMVYEALLAAEELKKKKIDCQVLNCHTVKPLDEKTLLKAVKTSGCAVTAEEHQVLGGLGGAVAEFLSENCPVPIIRVGVKDRFGESGRYDELQKVLGLTAKDIIKAVQVAVAMKKSLK